MTAGVQGSAWMSDQIMGHPGAEYPMGQSTNVWESSPDRFRLPPLPSGKTLVNPIDLADKENRSASSIDTAYNPTHPNNNVEELLFKLDKAKDAPEEKKKSEVRKKKHPLHDPDGYNTERGRKPNRSIRLESIGRPVDVSASCPDNPLSRAGLVAAKDDSPRALGHSGPEPLELPEQDSSGEALVPKPPSKVRALKSVYGGAEQKKPRAPSSARDKDKKKGPPVPSKSTLSVSSVDDAFLLKYLEELEKRKTDKEAEAKRLKREARELRRAERQEREAAAERARLAAEEEARVAAEQERLREEMEQIKEAAKLLRRREAEARKQEALRQAEVERREAEQRELERREQELLQQIEERKRQAAEAERARVEAEAAEVRRAEEERRREEEAEREAQLQAAEAQRILREKEAEERRRIDAIEAEKRRLEEEEAMRVEQERLANLQLEQEKLMAELEEQEKAARKLKWQTEVRDKAVRRAETRRRTLVAMGVDVENLLKGKVVGPRLSMLTSNVPKPLGENPPAGPEAIKE